jgi:hypothetical protein
VNPIGRGGEGERGGEKKGKGRRGEINRQKKRVKAWRIIQQQYHIFAVPREVHSEESEDGQTVSCLSMVYRLRAARRRK